MIQSSGRLRPGADRSTLISSRYEKNLVVQQFVSINTLLIIVRPMMFVLITLSFGLERSTIVVFGRSLSSESVDHDGSSRSSVNNERNHRECPPVSQQSHLNSYLWTLRRPDPLSPPSYFFGTIHVPYTRVWEYVPSNAKQAFRYADAVHFELDLLDRSTVSALNACQMLPRGQSLSDVLPNDIYRRLKRHLDYVRRNMPEWMMTSPTLSGTDGTAPSGGTMGDVASSSGDPTARARALYTADYLFNAIAGNWERKRPVYVLLMVNSLTESDIRSRGTPVLDLYLAQEATRAGKQIAAVEHVEEHCVPLNSMSQSQVLFALNQTLTQYESRRSGFTPPLSSVDDGLSPLYTADDLVHQYNCGDLNAALFMPPPDTSSSTGNGREGERPTTSSSDAIVARQINEYFRFELIDKRNRRMADRIDRLLNERPRTSFFFAFGAGHFIGNNSLIELLQNRGYDIRHTPPNEQIDFTRPRHRLRHDRVRSTPRTQFIWQSPVTTSGRISPRSNFNDLWVRLDSTSTADVNSNQIEQDVPSLADIYVTDVASTNRPQMTSHHVVIATSLLIFLTAPHVAMVT